MRAQHEIDVRVVSAEEADHGVAELWMGDELLGFTRVEDAQLVLRIASRRDGADIVVNVHSLAKALASAKQLLESI